LGCSARGDVGVEHVAFAAWAHRGALAGGLLVSELPKTRFTRASDVDIAYQIVGPAAGLDPTQHRCRLDRSSCQKAATRQHHHRFDRAAGPEQIIMHAIVVLAKAKRHRSSTRPRS
jgi:hypothetical protein